VEAGGEYYTEVPIFLIKLNYMDYGREELSGIRPRLQSVAAENIEMGGWRSM
jgi:hypothetical protein